MAQMPFIPPLPTNHNSQNNTPAAIPPVIPDPPGDADANWAGRGMHGGNYPIHYPSSPFVPGFIPPAANFHSTPGHPHTGLPPHRPPPLGPEFSGYAGPQQTPWSAPIQAVPGWGPPPPRAPFGQFPQHAPIPYAHSTPFPLQQAGWPQQQAPPGWGQPVNPMMQMHALGTTPMYQGGLLNFDGWNAPPSAMWGHQPLPPGPFPPQNEASDHMSTRVDARSSDRVSSYPFTAGPGYGPVLEPFQVQLLEVPVKINPLLEPVPDNSDRPHLKWDMLFRSNDCSRSTDGPHVSWSDGRDDPATFPRISKMSIISETIPWTIEVKAENPTLGITCGEVIETLADSFHQLTSQADYEALDSKKKNEVATVYRKNRSREPGMPGGALKEGMRRLDFLGRNHVFGGVYADPGKVFKILGTMPPCTFVLECVRQNFMTAQEISEHEEKQKALQNKERKAREEAQRKTEEEEIRRMTALRRAMGRATVEDDVDSDDERPD